MKRNVAILFLATIFVIGFTGFVIAVDPSGGTVVEGTSSTATPDSADTTPAEAGNVTELTITGFSTTQTWQGYFGNVSGAIQLADSSSNVLYNWTLTDPQGEVYASTNSSITWTDVQCFNFSASGTYADESGNGGGTNLHGTNLTILESMFNIESDDVDGVDETFSLIGAGTHDLFYVANQEFSEGECQSTRVFGDSGQGESNEFEEVLLYEPSSASVIFAALLEESSVLGFDGRDHDFQMLVLEDGHGTDTATTEYFFFVELE